MMYALGVLVIHGYVHTNVNQQLQYRFAITFALHYDPYNYNTASL